MGVTIPGPALGFGLAPGRIALLRAHAPDGARIVDKMPPNFLYLGFIATIRPGARIIHCRCHPLDTCLWLFFPYFSASQPYAYSLGHLGFYCREYRRLWPVRPPVDRRSAGPRWRRYQAQPPAAQGRARPIGGDGGNAPLRRRSERAWPDRNRILGIAKDMRS